MFEIRKIALILILNGFRNNSDMYLPKWTYSDLSLKVKNMGEVFSALMVFSHFAFEGIYNIWLIIGSPFTTMS